MILHTVGNVLNKAIDCLFISNELAFGLFAFISATYQRNNHQSDQEFQAEKLPSYLAIVFPSESNGWEDTRKQDGTVQDLSSIATQCNELGIKILSIYTRHGMLKLWYDFQRRSKQISALPPTLQRRILYSVSTNTGWEPQFQDIEIPTSSSSQEEAPEDKKSCTTIQFLSYEDRQSAVARVIQGCADNRTKEPHGDISEKVSNVLETRYGPPPTLLIVFGSRICLDGYPPWHLRYSEIQ